MAKKICGNCFSAHRGHICPNCGYTETHINDEDDALPIGTRLNDRYIVGRILGKGGFGIIYLAYDEKDDKAVAVKEYYPKGSATRTNDNITVIPMTTFQTDAYSDGLERFFGEAEIITKFSESSEILGVYDVFRANGTAYYVMEFVKGASLKQYTDCHGAISEGQAAYIAEKLLPALAVLHRENTFHRDVCPDNIMLCANGAVRLIDFGSARIIQEESSKSVSVILKPGFAPLEQYSRKGKQDGRTDIYSLGSSLYFGLTLDTPEDPITRLDNDDTFKEKIKSISSPLSAVIEKAAAVKTENRYENARKMLHDVLGCEIEIERFDPDKIKEAAKSSAEYSRVVPKKKHRGLIASAAAVIAAAIIGVSAAAFQNAKGPQTVMIGDTEYSVEDTVDLDLSDKGLSNGDIINLHYLKNLKTLNLNDNNITDLSCLQRLTGLEELYFNNNGVYDISFLKNMDGLRRISGEYNMVSDISVLAGKTELEQVFFGDCNNISDITPLKDCRKLTKIGFNEQPLYNIEALRGMTELEMVCLRRCSLSDISPLSESKKLKYVYLGWNSLEDVSPLQGCELMELYVNGNNLSSHSDTFKGITINGFVFVAENGMTWMEIEQLQKYIDGDYDIYDDYKQ